MPLLNYTTAVAVEKSLAEVQARLARHGARSIQTDYDGRGNPVAVAFLIDTPHGPRHFRLPADTEATWRVLVRDNKAGKVAPRFVTREQAARVSWRIIKDWLEAQLALIETEMVSLTQVMLPYMQPWGPERPTVYEAMVENRLLLPPGQAAEGE